LLTASLRLGGLCAAVAPSADELLGRIGECIGLLFQIGDDILDVEGTSEVLGKTAGKDAASEKLTFPGLYGLDESKRKQRAVLEEATTLADGMPQAALWHSLLQYLTLRQT
ncbi:MAG: polyprenyl synthetase family protein, partial [Thermoanaerobaculia bacterium]|nr:polyprenyl synthetase family protein [Thermoanaerobaculia bacterium]